MAKEQKGLGAASLSLICLLISGMGIGWLLGLSVSPVLHIIVASVMALVMGIVGALAGLNTNPKPERNDSEDNKPEISTREKLVKISPFPMTALIAGLAIGACLGVYTRTNELLGANPQRLVQKWNGVNGLDDASIKRRLFDQLYPPTVSNGTSDVQLLTTEKGQNRSEEPSSITSTKVKPVGETQADKPASRQESVTSHAGTLFSLSVQECGLLRLQEGEELRTRLKALNKSYINSFIAKCESDQCIEALKEILCPVKD
jgi:hypothetical protein